MPPAAPPFPALEEWKRMSEREQDALLDRLEARKRRGRIAARALIGLAGVAAMLVVGIALLTLA